MTTAEYVQRVEELARARRYAEALELAGRLGPEMDDHLTLAQVRVLRVHLKHAAMVLDAAVPAGAPARH